MLHPGSYLRLRDAVIDQIAASPIPELDAARKLIYRLWCRNLYKCVVIRVMQPEKHAFDADVWGRSEDFIKQGIFFHKGEHAGDGQKIVLSRYDIIVQKCKIHHGQGADDPLSKMRFLEKEKLNKISIFDYNELPEAIIADKDSYDAQLPRSLMECSIRIYCRDSAKCDLLRHAFEQWWSYIGDEYKDQSTTLSPGVEHNEILFISQEYDENE